MRVFVALASGDFGLAAKRVKTAHQIPRKGKEERIAKHLWEHLLQSTKSNKNSSARRSTAETDKLIASQAIVLKFVRGQERKDIQCWDPKLIMETSCTSKNMERNREQGWRGPFLIFMKSFGTIGFTPNYCQVGGNRHFMGSGSFNIRAYGEESWERDHLSVNLLNQRQMQWQSRIQTAI